MSMNGVIMILGITGGVGSGKSTVLKYLENRYKAYIIEADMVAKEIMEPGHIVYDRVVGAFPGLLLDEKGNIDRPNLASIVFNDEKKLKLLNSIVHPGVKDEIKDKINAVKAADSSKIVVIEAALLIEDGYKEICDEIWFVYCEREERIKRLIASRGYSRAKAVEIMNNQMSDEEFKRNTNEFIDNTSSEEWTHEQIDTLLGRIGK